jgi:xylan 1,4-beta-xylosidase
MFDSLRRYLDIVARYPQYRETEFFNDESDVVWTGNRGVAHASWLNFRNTHYFPGFVCKMVDTYCTVVEDEYRANLAVVDSDNCHLQWERYLFSGNRSQFTPLVAYPSTDLIRKPAYNAYVLLSRLRDNRLTVSCTEEGYGVKFGVLPTLDDDSLAVMAWNFEDGMEQGVNDRRLSVTIDNIPFSGRYRLVHYRIDAEHSSSYGEWVRLGKPAEPTPEQVAAIREREGLELACPVKDVNLEKTLTVALDLPMHAVSLLLVVPSSSVPPVKPEGLRAVVESGFTGAPQVFLKWDPSPEKDFLHYLLLRSTDGRESSVVADSPSFSAAVHVDAGVSTGGAYAYRVCAVNASGVQSDPSDECRVSVQ